jgi:hypothetical protein
MIKITEQLVTQTQLEIIMTAWNTCAEVPTKNKKVFVAFPWKEHAEITRTTFKSDYNKPLFKIEFFSH